MAQKKRTFCQEDNAFEVPFLSGRFAVFEHST